MPLKCTVSTYESGKGRALCGRRIIDIGMRPCLMGWCVKTDKNAFFKFFKLFTCLLQQKLTGPMGWPLTHITKVQSYARTYVVCGSNVRIQQNSVAKNSSVVRSKTDEKVDSSKFELECGVRNQRFFWLVQPFTTLARKHHTAPCFTRDFIPYA